MEHKLLEKPQIDTKYIFLFFFFYLKSSLQNAVFFKNYGTIGMLNTIAQWLSN